jgi:hypothetical protein
MTTIQRNSDDFHHSSASFSYDEEESQDEMESVDIETASKNRAALVESLVSEATRNIQFWKMIILLLVSN